MVDSRYALSSVVLALVVVASVTAVFVAFSPTALPGGGEYDRTTVTLVDDGEAVAEVEVRVADTYEKRYTGLSDTESLGPDEGMLFVHDEESRHAYVMRDMSFPIDIVFVAANGTITEIHHAERPSEETAGDGLTRYTGTGKYVLELPYGYTNETDVDEGDTVRIEDDEY